MPNRSIIFVGALFAIFAIGLLFKSSGSSSRINNDQDFRLIIPPSQSHTPEGYVPIITDDVAQDVFVSEDEQRNALAEVIGREHVTVSSKLTGNKKWWPIDFKLKGVSNPSIVPCPDVMKADRWMMIGQYRPEEEQGFSKALICESKIENESMVCVDTPESMPVTTGVSTQCQGKLDRLNYEVGPRGGKAFFGPTRPYFLYGSPSSHNCLGMWMQDLSRLHFWKYQTALDRTEPFFQAVDLTRPAPVASIEQNWFVFFDRNDEMYIHYDFWPKRSFAKVNAMGGVGTDLGPVAELNDHACLQKYLPEIKHPAHERIVQGTNSLSVTMCDYVFEDEKCFETEQNTFILTILNIKSSFITDLYEPYPVLFKRTAPFEIHAIGKKPLWIKGRQSLAHADPAYGFNGTTDKSFEVNQMSFVKRDRAFHGYQNDAIYLTFDIDGERQGAIDTTPADLLQDIGLCS